MRVALYTLTRERLEYTQRSFQSLWDKAGYEVDHFIIDNGSKDGTVEWLLDNSTKFRSIELLADNVGISAASNRALDWMRSGNYDLIGKMDNDCEIVTSNLIARLVELFKHTKRQLLVSPRVEGINKQPKRAYTVAVNGYEIGRTGIVGGLCHWMLGSSYQRYRYPLDLPKAWGQDDDVCHWAYQNGIEVGYVESLQVNHIDGTDAQAIKYPDYFKRKWEEEKMDEATS